MLALVRWVYDEFQQDFNLMSDDLQEHRDFYRIQDKALIQFETVTPEAILDPEQIFPIATSARFHLLNELHGIDNEHTQTLRAIGEKDRSVAAYLKALNAKLDTIARAVAEISDPISEDEDDAPPPDEQPITLSEGGVSFNHGRSVRVDSYLAIKLVLLPSYLGLELYGRVVNCNESIRGDYLLNVVFEHLGENERQLLARHVLQRQAQERRENLATVTPLRTGDPSNSDDFDADPE